MFTKTKAFSSFAVPDLDAARSFYGETLGLEVGEGPEGVLALEIEGDQTILVYPKPDFTPATYTVLNFPVDDVDAAVDELTARGVEFRRPVHRLVQGPGREHPLGAEAGLSRYPRSRYALRGK